MMNERSREFPKDVLDLRDILRIVMGDENTALRFQNAENVSNESVLKEPVLGMTLLGPRVGE